MIIDYYPETRKGVSSQAFKSIEQTQELRRTQSTDRDDRYQSPSSAMSGLTDRHIFFRWGYPGGWVTNRKMAF